MRKLTYVVLITLLLSCSCEKQSEPGRNPFTESDITGTTQTHAQTSGRYALEITPDKASRGTTVSLIFNGIDARGAKIEWLLNGTPQESETPGQFTLSQARKGDTLQAKALIQGREILSNTVEVGNAPPEITICKLVADPGKPNDALGVAAAGSDADGDPVTLLYEWTVNGSPAGTGERLGRAVKRGDRISVKVTPFDGEDYGRPVFLEQEIQNLPPVIEEHKDFTFDGTTCTYQTRASDPDGDALVYSLESPQPGMTIDASTGLFKWIVPAEFKGKQDATIVVNDGHGGTARYTLRIGVQ